MRHDEVMRDGPRIRQCRMLIEPSSHGRDAQYTGAKIRIISLQLPYARFDLIVGSFCRTTALSTRVSYSQRVKGLYCTAKMAHPYLPHQVGHKTFSHGKLTDKVAECAADICLQ